LGCKRLHGKSSVVWELRASKFVHIHACVEGKSVSGAIRGAKGGGSAPPVIAGLQISTSIYGQPIPIVWGQAMIPGNLLWYGNFQAVPVSASGGGKGGGGSTPSSYNYTAAGLVGLCEGGANGIIGLGQILNSKNQTTLQALGLTFFEGNYPQTPWGYLTTNYPTQADGYPGIAYVASSAFQLSSSAQMPNILYEVRGLKQYGSAGQTPLTCTFSGSTVTTSAPHGLLYNSVVRVSSTVEVPTPYSPDQDYYVVLIPQAAVTISSGGTAVVSWPNHNLVPGSMVTFGLGPGGVLPSPLVAGNTYYVSSAGFSANSFQFADTAAHALAGTNSIVTSGATAPTIYAESLNTLQLAPYPYQVGATSGNPTMISVGSAGSTPISVIEVMGATASFSGNVMTVVTNPTNSQSFAVGQVISASGVTAGTTITGYGAGPNVFTLSTTPRTLAARAVTAYTNQFSHNGLLINGDVVQLSSSGSLPGGFSGSTNYSVVDANATTASLSATDGGVAIQPTNAGSGTITATQDAGSGTYSITPYVQGANPADVITDYITNTTYGVNGANPYGAVNSSQIPLSGLSGSASSFSNYCVANGIFISPALTSQQQASDFIKEVCDITNSAPVWSQGNLTIIPYGDTAVTGNGVTFTPNTTVQYAFTDDDYLDDGSGDPIVVTRSNPADAFNQVQVGFPDRTNQYNPNIAQSQDQANIDLYGLRPMPIIQHDYITDAQVARNVAQVKLQRVLYVRNQYTFKLGWKYALLEPMDLVSLTDSALGFNGLVVRVIQVEEDSDEQLSIIAEDYLVNNATVQAVAPPLPGGATTMMNADPGLSNTPVIFDAPGILTASGFELWMASAGGANWGGAQVWVSTDNETYVQAGTINAPARYGVTSTSYPAGTDPDTTDTLGINLSVSGGVISSGSSADADNHNTLALIDDPGNPELIAYSTATLTGANQYSLTAYTRRGVYGTSNAAHASGVPFVRLDDAIFKYAYNPAWVGKTIYVKLLPFNLYGASQYTLAMVTATAYTIQGSISRPSPVTGFAASQNGNVVVFQWNASPDPIGYIAGFEFRYAPPGSTAWASAIPITKVTKGTQITTAKVPPGSWTLMACEVDVSGNYSVTPATCNLNVVNANVLISSNNEAPAWPGTLTDMVQHWTGVIYPDSQTLASATGGTTPANDPLWNDFVYNPFPSCAYQGAVIDSGFASNDRVWGSVGCFVPPTAGGSVDPLIELQTSPDNITWSGYAPWTIGTADTRYYQMEFVIDTTDGDTPCINSFIPTVDAVQQTLTGSGVTIAGGGTAVCFTAAGISTTAGAQTFHNAPVVTASAVGSAALTAVVNSVTATGCTVHVFNSSDTDVGGTVNISATGG
jgi:hypothetical protein